MNRNNLAASLALGVALTLSGCAAAGDANNNSAGSNTNNTQNAAQSNDGATHNAPSAEAAPPSSSPSTVSNNSTSPSATTTPTKVGASGAGAQAANAPKPQIGSGGNDFYLFTQARAALGADAELKGANVIINAKEGVLTLSGTVASTEQKARAEQVAQGVGGVKAVKNQIKVSAVN